MTATELEPRTTWFINKHSTSLTNTGQFGQMVECLFAN